MLRKSCVLVLPVLLSLGAPCAWAIDANVTPDVIFGSGNPNGSFTVDQNNGVELGLRAKIPFVGTINSGNDGTYSYTLAELLAAHASRRWNFDWTVNTDHLGTSGVQIDELTYLLGIDFDPSQGTNFLEFDPVTPTVPTPFFDHSIGDNSTPNGGGTEAADAATYATLIANNNVLQQSWRHAFFPIHPSLTYDPTIDGTYDIVLSAFNGGGALVASTTIQVIIGAGGGPALVARVVEGASPGDDFNVYIDLVTATDDITDVGTVLTFDDTVLDFVTALPGVDVTGAPSWAPDFVDDTTAGRVEVHIQDTFGATRLSCPSGPCTFEVLCIRFEYLATPCTTDVDFATAASLNPLVFPVNHFVHFNPGGGGTPVLVSAAVGSAASVEAHGFIRADVNVSGVADIQDIIDLAAFLFTGLVLPDCEAARDTNNSGTLNITDLVTAVQGIFNGGQVTIPPPFPTAGVGPTVLGCNLGLPCP